MTEKKLTPAAKIAATSKTSARKSGAVSGKSETTKATAATASKKTVAQKSAPKKTAPKKAISATKKTEAVAVKKAATAAAGRKTPPRNVPVAKAATSRGAQAPREKAIANPTPEERYRMVETAAYFIAEQNGFQGRSDEHWLAAEREIAARLGC